MSKWINHSIKHLEHWIIASGDKDSRFHHQDFLVTVSAGGLLGKRTLAYVNENIMIEFYGNKVYIKKSHTLQANIARSLTLRGNSSLGLESRMKIMIYRNPRTKKNPIRTKKIQLQKKIRLLKMKSHLLILKALILSDYRTKTQ